MAVLEGQLGAGAGFLAIGLWQAYLLVKAYRLNSTSSNTKRIRYSYPFARNSEHLAVIVIAVLHMVFSLASSLSQSGNNGSGVGVVIPLERFGVAVVFLLYAIVALVSEATSALPLPAGMVDLLAMFAFGEEFLLFHLTGDEHSTGLETHYYSLLLVPIGVCFLATGAEIAYPAALLPPLIRSMALVLQGTWFFQMSISLFTTRWMVQGCELVQNINGDYTVSCAGMSLMKGRAIATLQFNLHLALLLLTSLPAYAILSKIYTAPLSYERLGEQSQVREVKETELSPADYFHVLGEEEEDEEQEVQSKDVPDTSGFHRVSI